MQTPGRAGGEREGGEAGGASEIEALLIAADARIAARWRSLAPGREHPRSLVELAPDPALPRDVRLAVARALASIARAVERHFPHNLFCDLDLVAAELARGGARAGAAWVDRTSVDIEELHAVFGCETSIHFRYVHDFLYGFDWARWVRRDEATRAGIGPFDPRFLAHARRRGGELVELIAGEDAKYHRLAPGEDRNPFGFARDPRSEALLLRDLAARGWIPVEAWRADAQPCWDRDASAERERRARELGLAQTPAANR